MVSLIGSATYSFPASLGPSTGGLEARLERYQKELSACVNCDSANTREGRQTIQALSNKISEIKMRLEEVAVTQPNTQPIASNKKALADVSANGNVSAPEIRDNSVVATGSALSSATTTAGNRLDVFA